MFSDEEETESFLTNNDVSHDPLLKPRINLRRLLMMSGTELSSMNVDMWRNEFSKIYFAKRAMNISPQMTAKMRTVFSHFVFSFQVLNYFETSIYQVFEELSFHEHFF